jgi:hypothetical protein
MMSFHKDLIEIDHKLSIAVSSQPWQYTQNKLRTNELAALQETVSSKFTL